MASAEIRAAHPPGIGQGCIGEPVHQAGIIGFVEFHNAEPPLIGVERGKPHDPAAIGMKIAVAGQGLFEGALFINRP